MKKLFGLLSLLILSAPLTVPALTMSGTLEESTTPYDLYNFHVDEAGSVGVTLNGSTDAYLFLFSGVNTFNSGTYITEDDDSAGGLNSYINRSLGVGDYTAFITTHGAVWDGNSITWSHNHSPMSYDLTVTGPVSGETSSVPDAGTTLLLLGAPCAALMFFRKKAIA